MNSASLLVNGEALEGRVYLNTAAEGLPLKSCAEAVNRYLGEKGRGEPGRVAMFAAHNNLSELASQLFGVQPNQIAIKSSTTETLNMIAQGIDWREGDEVVFTSVEFPSNMFPWVALKNRGVVAKVVQPRDGLVRCEDILKQVTAKTRLVTVSQVSYATGQHVDPTPLWDALKETPTLLCIDATQAAGRVPIRGDQADFVVASTFKWLNSIHGSAILSASSRALASGVMGPAGWLSTDNCYSEDRLERFHPCDDATRFLAGMPNFAAVFALEQALEFNTSDRVSPRRSDLEPLVAQLREGLSKLDVPVLTPDNANDRAGIVAFRHERADDFKRHLLEQDIHIHADDGRVRAAVHWYNSADDIDRYLAAVAQLLKT